MSTTLGRTALATPPVGARLGPLRATIGDLISSRLTVAAETPIARVVKLFEANAQVDSIAVLDGSQVLLLARTRFFLQLGRRFGFSLYENRPVSLLAEEGSTVDSAWDPREVVALALQRDSERIYDDLLVLDGERYLGSVSMRSLLVHHKELLAASMAERAVLDEKNRRLEEVNRIQAEFAANMTHELRSPLNTMLGLASLVLGDESLGEQHRAKLFLLVSRGQELLGIINNMLDIARLDAGAMNPSVEPVTLEPLLEELLHSAEALAVGKPLRLQIDFRSLPRAFVTDPVFLRRIVTNLLSNAVKFTDCGTVVLGAEGQAGDLIVRVSDSGIGIREQDMPRLFTKFSQLESTKTKRHRGTGLGLAIVKALVERLGGAVRVESRPGAGSEFSVRLPGAGPHGAAMQIQGDTTP